MTEKGSASGKNILCYNPYLEPGLTGTNGENSNCMSCHRTAAIGNNPHNISSGPNLGANEPNYPPFLTGSSDYISLEGNKAEYFDCNTTTDFSWYLATHVGGSNPSSPQPPCTVPALPRKK